MLTTPALEWVGFKQRLKLLSLKESLPTMQIGLVYRNESLVAYSGERDRSFRPIVTAAHEMMLRG
jgi:hypothetical protein